MPQKPKHVHPLVSAIVLVSASAVTGILFLMNQAINVAEDLTSAVNTLNQHLEEKL